MAGVSPGQIINRARDSRPIRSATHPASGNYTQSIGIRRHPRNETDQFQSCNLLVAALGIDWKGRLLAPTGSRKPWRAMPMLMAALKLWRVSPSKILICGRIHPY